MNGTDVDQQRLFTATDVAASYGGVGAEGRIVVWIARTCSPDMQGSWLMIARGS